ncbi:MAG: hypothetical protein ABWK15_04605 [Dissulfuribacterales bacterium]
MSTEELLPHGEKLRNAVRWISEMAQEYPEKTRTSLIYEAETRFDLTPKECEFLNKKFICEKQPEN